MFMDPHGPTIVPRSPTAVIADKIKHIHFQKEGKNIFMPTISVLPLGSQSAQPFQPLAMRAEAWQAIPSVSTWVMTTLRRMAQSSALYFLPSRSATAGTQASQGTTAQADSNSPPLKEPNVGV